MIEIRNIRDSWGAAYVASDLKANGGYPLARTLGRLSRDQINDPSNLDEVFSLLCHMMSEIVSDYNHIIREHHPETGQVRWNPPRGRTVTLRRFRSLVRGIEKASSRFYSNISSVVPESAQDSKPSYQRTVTLPLREYEKPNRILAGYILMFMMPSAYLYLRHGVGIHSSDELIMDTLAVLVQDSNISLGELARNIRSRIDLMDAVYDYRSDHGLYIRVPYYRMMGTQEFIQTRETVLSGAPYEWIQASVEAI